jgi:hypothetical protein
VLSTHDSLVTSSTFAITCSWVVLRNDQYVRDWPDNMTSIDVQQDQNDLLNRSELLFLIQDKSKGMSAARRQWHPHPASCQGASTHEHPGHHL